MIFNMVTGGAAGVKVIAADSEEALPENKQEGTIAVITNVAIGAVLVQNETPASPEAGDVWVNTAVRSTGPVQLGNATLYPSGVKQYITGEWKSVSAYVFTLEGWQPLEMYLFRSGDLFEDVTGGWAVSTQMLGLAQITDNALETTSGHEGANYNKAAFRTKKAVDLSGYKTLRAQFTAVTATFVDQPIAVGVTATAFAEGKLEGNTAVLGQPSSCMSGYSQTLTHEPAAFTLEYDISALSDSMYVVVYFGAVKCACTSVQLIP